MKSDSRPLIPYLRQSRAKERTISIEEQRRDVRRWAETNGVELAREVVEQNVSGSKPWRERELGEVVKACELGEAGGIIVAWQDRLSRENGRATAEVWEALERAGARLVCAAEGLDTATGDHEMLFTIKAAIAREQWKRSRENWSRARRNAVERGVFPSGRVAIGYRHRPKSGKPLEVVPHEAAKVVEAFELRAAGRSFSEIARRFGWAHSTTRQILANETYVGTIRHGEYVRQHAHEPVVTRALFEAVQASRTVQRVPPGNTTRDRLLLGIARCAGCGRTLKVVRRPRADGTHVVSYFCKDAASDRCPSRAYVHADELDAFLGGWFAAAIESVPRMVDVVAACRELEQAEAELRESEAQLHAYVETADALDAHLFRRGLNARQHRVADARDRVRELSAHKARLPAGGALSDLWRRFDPLERRAVLAGFLAAVAVSRGASGDLAAHVTITWSDGSLAFPEIADDEHRVRVAAA
jgi:DNA invertase Pin-like site-specific DNA recombinase